LLEPSQTWPVHQPVSGLCTAGHNGVGGLGRTCGSLWIFRPSRHV